MADLATEFDRCRLSLLGPDWWHSRVRVSVPWPALSSLSRNAPLPPHSTLPSALIMAGDQEGANFTNFTHTARHKYSHKRVINMEKQKSCSEVIVSINLRLVSINFRLKVKWCKSISEKTESQLSLVFESVKGPRQIGFTGPSRWAGAMKTETLPSYHTIIIRTLLDDSYHEQTFNDVNNL